MATRNPKPKSIEKQKEKKPERLNLEELVKETAQRRDDVTRQLWGQLLDKITPRNFIKEVCKLTGIKAPKPHEPLAPTILKIQRDVLKFALIDQFDACDGKGGPITFDALIKKFPGFKKFSKEKYEPFRAGREKFVREEGVPALPSREKIKDKEVFRETGPISPEETVTIGDSLTYGMASYFYKGTGNFNTYRNKFFKGSRKVETMERLLTKNLDKVRKARAFTVWGGANNVGWMGKERIARHVENICTILMKHNPRARIILIPIPPMAGYTRFRRYNYKRMKEKIESINSRYQRFASRFKNVTYLDIYEDLEDPNPNQKGSMRWKYTGKDRLHLRGSVYEAIAYKVQDELQNGESQKLSYYTGSKRRRRHA